MCGCAGRGLDVVPCWWCLYRGVGFFFCDGGAVSSSSPPAGGGGGGGALTEPLLVCLLYPFSWGT